MKKEQILLCLAAVTTEPSNFMPLLQVFTIYKLLFALIYILSELLQTTYPALYCMCKCYLEVSCANSAKFLAYMKSNVCICYRFIMSLFIPIWRLIFFYCKTKSRTKPNKFMLIAVLHNLVSKS